MTVSPEFTPVTTAPPGALPGPTMARCALLGVRLRWRLTANRLRKGGVGLFVLVLLGCAGLAIGGLATFATTRDLSHEGRRVLLVVGFTLLVLGWTFMPLVGGGADETVDPTRLALLPLHRRQLAAVLAGAASCGPATLAAFVALIGVPIGMTSGGATSVGAAGVTLLVVAVPVVFALGLGIARLSAALLVRAQRSRRGRDLVVLVSGVAGVSLWLASQSVGPLLQQDNHSGGAVVDVLLWLPPGWAARGVMAAADGRVVTSVVGLGSSAVVAVGALLAWAAVTGRLLTASERTAGVRASDRRAPLGSAASPLGAAVAKELRYLSRSPGKRVQFLLGTLMGVGFALIQVIQMESRDDPKVVFFGLWGVVFTLSGSFNVVGFDSGSLWLEVIVGGLRREQLLARTLSWFPLLLVPPILGTLVIATWTGQWRFVPVAVALSTTAAACGLGVAAVISTLAPVPLTDGDNPFAWRQGMSGKGCITGLFTLGALVSVAVIGGPILIPCLIGTGEWWALPLATLGIPYGVAIWQLGVALGARRLDGRGPELLAELSPRALH